MRKLFYALIILVMSGNIFAQSKDANNDKTLDKYSVHTNRFWDNWFIGFNGGAQIFLGTDDTKLGFGDRIAWDFQGQLGKWFTPGLGLRGVMGLSRVNDGYQAGNTLQELHWKMLTVRVDGMLDLINLFAGYKEDRVYSIIPFAGAGIVYGKRGGTEVTLAAGLINQFRLNDKWNFNIEAKIGGFNGDFDKVRSKTNGNVSLSLGFTYKFKKRNFDRVSNGYSQAEMDAINKQVRDLQDRNAALQNEVNDLKNRKNVETREVIKNVADFSNVVVFFNIGKSNITNKDLVNLGEYANKIKNYPDSKFVITGYADKQTGSKEFNEKLSQKRAEAVYNALVEKFGVNKEQLVVDYKGGVDNMFFNDNKLSRVAIVRMK